MSSARRPLGLLASLLIATPATAFGQLALAPPVIAPEVKPPASMVERAITDELSKLGIEPIKRSERTAVRLAKCENKMSCLAKEGKMIGATHVLHAIVAQRQDEVLAQITILDIKTKKPVDIAKAKGGSSTEAVEATVRTAAAQAARALAALPEFVRDTIAIEPTPAPLPVAPPVASVPAIPAPGEVAGAVKTPPIRPEVQGLEKAEGTKAAGAVTPTPSSVPRAGSRPKPSAESETPVVEPIRGDAPFLPAESEPNYLAYGTGALGLAATVGGVIALALASSDATKRDRTPQVEVAERQNLHSSASSKQTAGIVLLIGGGVALVTGAILGLVGEEEPMRPEDYGRY